MPMAIEPKWTVLCCREKPLASSVAARTPNRLRWSGREYRGDRANRGEGTRQITPVTLGEGGPERVMGLAPGALAGRRDQGEATVY